MSRLALVTAPRRQCRITPLRGQTEAKRPATCPRPPAGQGQSPGSSPLPAAVPQGDVGPTCAAHGRPQVQCVGCGALRGVRGQARPPVGRARRRVPQGEGRWRHVSRSQADPGGGAGEGTQAEDRGPTPCFLGLTAQSRDRGQGHVDPVWLPWAQGAPAPPLAVAVGTLSPQEPRSHRAMTLGHTCPHPPGRPESVRVPFRATERLMSNV